MLVSSILEADLAVLSLSVQSWYRHYRAKPDDSTSEVICSAAVDLFNRGHRTQEELTRILIARFPGAPVTYVNAPTAGALH